MSEKKKPQFQGVYDGKPCRAWRKRGYILVEVDAPDKSRIIGEWKMPTILGFVGACSQAALQSKWPE